ncbi:hypothetical protein TNIN_85501 [Trichonephila inaurata madagascariensis]|uniref:Uncharacterized protein n=1 Tax=Trichonephila inaurata madagascariensis TaxID=2747483 RepID=A0A8X7C909_9ARAC|nr:hypothetical protein TNIN_85501 [Trichonephila inaurata madagascariensis]
MLSQSRVRRQQEQQMLGRPRNPAGALPLHPKYFKVHGKRKENVFEQLENTEKLGKNDFLFCPIQITQFRRGLRNTTRSKTDTTKQKGEKNLWKRTVNSLLRRSFRRLNGVPDKSGDFCPAGSVEAVKREIYDPNVLPVIRT